MSNRVQKLQEKQGISLEIISQQFVDDVEITDENIAKHGFRVARIWDKWTMYKLEFEQLFENEQETQKKLFEKIKKEYFGGIRKTNVGVVSKHNVDEVIKYDNEWINYNKKLKEIENIIRYINECVFPYLGGENWLIGNINKFLRG